MAGMRGVWPGQQTGYTGDPNALFSAVSREQMSGSYGGPRPTGPFNFQPIENPIGQWGQMFAPMLLSGIVGGNQSQFQFMPQQSAYDQLVANRYYRDQMQAMTIASRRDQRTISGIIGGATEFATGKPLTDVQRARNQRIAEGVGQFMPLLAQISPDTADQLAGSRGSATVMAQQLQKAFRTAYDPVTGRVGMRGESTGAITSELYEQFFGPGANLAKMRGLSAGRAGVLLNEMQQRGMLGSGAGTSLEDRLKSLPGALGDDQVARIAERIKLDDGKSLTERRAAGENISSEMLSDARGKVRDTFQKLKSADPKTEAARRDLLQSLDKLPGGDDILRASDAARYASKLENMAGAVEAMREIFGDMGDSNAPMSKIMNGLNIITQGQLANMAPGQIEQMVRHTQAVANQTGISVDAQLAMAAGLNPLAQRLGIDPSFSMRAVQQSAAFGASLPAMPGFGRKDKEKMMLLDQQLRLHAAASPMAHQLGAVMSMREQGVLRGMKGDTQLAAMIKAVEAGKLTYQFDGKEHTVNPSRIAMLDMLKRDANVTQAESMAFFTDTLGSEEMRQKFGIDSLARQQQTKDAASGWIARGLGGRYRSMLEQRGVRDQLVKEGVFGAKNSQKQLRAMAEEISIGVGADVFTLTDEERNDPAKRRQALGARFQNRLREAIKTRMPKADAATIERVMQQTLSQLGGADGMENVGAATFATLNMIGKQQSAFGSGLDLLTALDPKVHEQMRVREASFRMEAMSRSALSGLAQAGPLARFSDAIQNANSKTSAKELMAQILNAQDINAIADKDPTGQVAAMLGKIKDTQALNPADPAQMKQAEKNMAIVRGLIEGGDAATTALQGDGLDDKTKAALEKAQSQASTVKKIMEDADKARGGETPKAVDAAMTPAAAATMSSAKEAAKTTARDTTSATPVEQQDKKLTVTIKGTLTDNGDGTVTLDGEGPGIFESIMGALG